MRERERESPPSIQFQFTFQFQGALLARLCLSDAKAINKRTRAFKAKRKQKKKIKNTVALYYGKHYNRNNNNKHWNHFNLPPIPFLCTWYLWGVSAGFSFPLLIVMGYGKCSTKLCKHVEAKRRQQWKTDHSKWVSQEMIGPLWLPKCKPPYPTWHLSTEARNV